MKPVPLTLCVVGLVGGVVGVVLWRAPREVKLPVYSEEVRFFSEEKQSLLVANRPGGKGSLSAEACASCHKKEYAEWKASAHSRSVTEPVFAAAFKAEPRALCRSCHSPLLEQHPVLVHQMRETPRVLINGAQPSLPAGHPPTDAAVQALPAARVVIPGRPHAFIKEPNPDYDAKLASEGVTCVTCHVREGTILTANPTALSNVPHSLSFSPAMRTADYCGGCHQFEVKNPRFHAFERDPVRSLPNGKGQRVRKASFHDRVVFQGSHGVMMTGGPGAAPEVTQGQDDTQKQDEEEPPVPSMPGLEDQYQEEPRVQHTLDEFRLSPSAARGETCQSCHMPPSGGRRMHNWEGRDSLTMLQKAITMSPRLDRAAYKVGETLQAVIRLKNDAGHRFPTGDSIHAGILDVWLRDGKKTLGRQVYIMSSQGTTPAIDGLIFFDNGKGGMLIPGGMPGGSKLEGPNRRDTRLLPGEEAMLVFKQPVTAQVAKAKDLNLRVRVFHSAVHPGFKDSSIDPKLNAMRLIREEVLPVRIGSPPPPAAKETALAAGTRPRG